MTIEEIKLRRVVNQHLTAPVDKLRVVRDLCGVQAQFMTNALHALKIRSNGEITPEGLVKNWTVRGTVHVFAADELPLYKHRAICAHAFPADAVHGDRIVSDKRKKMFAELIVESVTNGVDSREGHKEVCAAAGMTERESGVIFDSWGGTIRDLCEAGFICHKVTEKKAFMPSPAFVPIPEEEAKLELTRRYFTNFGPCTLRDAAYFFGCPQAAVKTALAKLPVVTVESGGAVYYYIENRDADYDVKMPAALYLAGFDQLMLGYRKDDSPFLPPEYLRGIFNLAGIVIPPLLLDGTVAGRWKMKNGRLELYRFREFSPREKRAAETEAERLWSGSLKKIEYML